MSNNDWTKLQTIDTGLLDNSAGSRINSLTLSGDGSIVAYADNAANTVKIYKNVNGVFSQLGASLTGNSGDNFGFSVSLSDNGSRIAIGANNANTNTGYVQIYEYSNSSWSQVGNNLVGSASNIYFGTSVSLSNDGSIVAIGASNPDTGSTNEYVQIYEYSNSSWTQKGNNLTGLSSNIQFGKDIQLSNDGLTLAIGSPGYNNEQGTVEVYNYSSNTWSKIGSQIDGESVSDRSGYSVSISGDGSCVAIGAYANTDGNTIQTNAGHVRVYKNISNSWTQLGGDIDGSENFMAGERLGWEVSLNNDGTVLGISVPFGNEFEGAVKSFEYSNNQWSQKGSTITDSTNEGMGTYFGSNSYLSNDGTTIALTMPLASGHIGIQIYNFPSGGGNTSQNQSADVILNMNIGLDANEIQSIENGIENDLMNESTKSTLASKFNTLTNTQKKELRRNLFKLYFPEGTTRTKIYTSKEAIGLENTTSFTNKNSIVLIKNNSTFGLDTLNSDEGIYCFLEDGDGIACTMSDSTNVTQNQMFVFSRQDNSGSERYTLQFQIAIQEDTFKIVSGCENITGPLHGVTTIGGYFVENDVFSYNGKVFNVGSLTSGDSNTSSSVCLLKGTKIKTDNHGDVPIEQLKKGMTIFGSEILGYTKGLYEGKLIEIKKDSFRKNCPSKDTFITPEHSILVNGNLMIADKLLPHVSGMEYVDNIPLIEREVYNVLCSKWQIMMANDVPVESLHPKFDKEKNTLYML